MPDIDQMIRVLRANPWDDRYEPTTGDIADAIKNMRDTLEIIAAQDSGIAGSTNKADCMAALARAALRN